MNNNDVVKLYRKLSNSGLGFALGDDGDSPYQAIVAEYGETVAAGAVEIAHDMWLFYTLEGGRIIVANANGPWAVRIDGYGIGFGDGEDEI